MANEDTEKDNYNVNDGILQFEDNMELDLEEIHIAQQKRERAFDAETEVEEQFKNQAQIDVAEVGKLTSFEDKEMAKHFSHNDDDNLSGNFQNTEQDLILELDIVEDSNLEESIPPIVDVTEDDIVNENLILDDIELSLADEAPLELLQDEKKFEFVKKEEGYKDMSYRGLSSYSCEDTQEAQNTEDDFLNNVAEKESSDMNSDELTIDELDLIESITDENTELAAYSSNVAEDEDDNNTLNELSEKISEPKSIEEEPSKTPLDNVDIFKDDFFNAQEVDSKCVNIDSGKEVVCDGNGDNLLNLSDKASDCNLTQEVANLLQQIKLLQNSLSNLSSDKSSESLNEIKEELQDFKEQLTLQTIQLFEGLSFSDEFNEIKNFIEDRFDESNKIASKNEVNDDFSTKLNAVESKILEKLDYLEEQEIFGGKTDLVSQFEEKFLKLISNSVDDISEKLVAKVDDALSEKNEEKTTPVESETQESGYNYGFADVESDLTKMRVVVNEISGSLKELNCSLVDANGSSLQLDTLSDDISSISKRTNKLILTSEDAHKTLKHYLEDFEQTVESINEAASNLKSYPQQISALNSKIDNLARLLLSATKSDKAINDALVYLAQWIDGASNSLEKLKKELYLIKTESFLNQADKIQSLEGKIYSLESKFEEQAKSDREIKSMIELVLEQLSVANNSLKRSLAIDDKLDMLEHKMSKFEKNINKIASYIEE